VCDRRYVFDAQQPPSGSKPIAFDPTGKCPAFVVNPQIARAALKRQHADEVQYGQLVKANVAVAPIHSGLDGGMNGVFLAQVGGSLPPARVPPSASRPPPPPDNEGSASKLFGLFGLKSAPKTQVASADPTTLERGAPSAATGSIVPPKVKLASQIYTVTGADPSEPPKNESAKNDAPEPQKTVAAQPEPLPQQEADSALSPGSDNTVSALPTGRADSFESRWSGLQKSDLGAGFAIKTSKGPRTFQLDQSGMSATSRPRRLLVALMFCNCLL
jgi:hypothetical protein